MYLIELYSDQRHSLLIRPAHWSERQKRQQSILMIFSNKIFDLTARKICEPCEFDADIPWSQKQNIAKYEDLSYIYGAAKSKFIFNISDASYCKLINSYHPKNGSLISNEASEMRRDSFANRFILNKEIMPIGIEYLKESAISIIIDKKSKNGILRQLRAVGIDQYFLFPEMEYTAKYLKVMFSKN